LNHQRDCGAGCLRTRYILGEPCDPLRDPFRSLATSPSIGFPTALETTTPFTEVSIRPRLRPRKELGLDDPLRGDRLTRTGLVTPGLPFGFRRVCLVHGWCRETSEWTRQLVSERAGHHLAVMSGRLQATSETSASRPPFPFTSLASYQPKLASDPGSRPCDPIRLAFRLSATFTSTGYPTALKTTTPVSEASVRPKPLAGPGCDSLRNPRFTRTGPNAA